MTEGGEVRAVKAAGWAMHAKRRNERGGREVEGVEAVQALEEVGREGHRQTKATCVVGVTRGRHMRHIHTCSRADRRMDRPTVMRAAETEAKVWRKAGTTWSSSTEA